ncbi:MAG: hypothetical protein JST16_10000 [Bdellovibrionales bacterium]|nr:hypothetical protein [Bdellovibrionales bacterium]
MAGAERKETLEVGLEPFFRTVCDFAKYPEFVSGAKAARLLPPEGDITRVEFEFDMMKRVKYVLRIQSKLDVAAGTGTVSWTMESSDMFKSNVGGWTMKSLAPNKIEVVYKLDVDFNFSVPGFVLKGFIAKALPAAIQEFANRAKKVSA